MAGTQCVGVEPDSGPRLRARIASALEDGSRGRRCATRVRAAALRTLAAPGARNPRSAGEIVRRIEALTLTRTQERNRMHAAGRCAELTSAIAWDIEAHLEHLAQSMGRRQQQALAIVTAHPELARRFARLVSVRGIASVSALRILAELAELPADMIPRQWVAHAGLDRRALDSGTSLHKPARISKKGNRHLRAALYMPATVSVREEPNVRGFYQKRITGGLKPIQALVAVDRKLLHAIPRHVVEQLRLRRREVLRKECLTEKRGSDGWPLELRLLKLLLWLVSSNAARLAEVRGRQLQRIVSRREASCRLENRRTPGSP